MRLWRRVADAARSPKRLVAFAARIGRAIVRGEAPAIVARLRAVGYTPGEYRRWRRRVPVPRGESVPFVLLLDPPDANDTARMHEALGSFSGRARTLLVRTGGDRWREIGAETAGRPLGDWIDELRIAWLWWVVRPARFAPGADAAVAVACRRPSARLVYADHEVVDDREGLWPVFKPAFDILQAYECDLPGPWLGVHASLASGIGTLGPGSTGLRRLLVEAAGPSGEGVVHVPFVCAREVRGPRAAGMTDTRAAVLPAVVDAAAAAGLRLEGGPHGVPWLRPVGACRRVSIVIPTRDRADLLERCLRIVGGYRGSSDVDVVVIDNGSIDRRVASVLEAAAADMPLAVVRIDEPFNFARLCNAGVGSAAGEVVVLLNNDTEPCAGWLDELAGLAAQPLVGAVGPLLVYPDGRVQSAGVLVGVNRTATSALEGFAPDDRVARDWCATRRRVSAVLGACLAVERRKYLAVGGMDEDLAVSHNEVDLCLRLEAAGYVNAFTPFARVVHCEGSTRGYEVTAAERRRLDAEEARFLQRWQPLVRGCDPAYHPALARTGRAFALGPVGSGHAPREGWREPVAQPCGLPARHPLESLPADTERTAAGPALRSGDSRRP